MTTIPGYNDTPELKREREIANIENILECGYGHTNKPISKRRRQELKKRLIELKQIDIVDHPGPLNTCSGCISLPKCQAGISSPRIINANKNLGSFCLNKMTVI